MTPNGAEVLGLPSRAVEAGESVHPRWKSTRLNVPGLKPRRTQDAVFSETLRRLDSETIVALEADTGAGKSMIVAPLAASGGPVVYSARTKDQQRQMRDITGPMLREAGLLPEGMAVLMGRANYVCLRRAGEAGLRGLKLRGDGTRLNYADLGDPNWAEVRSDVDDGCASGTCGQLDAYQAARRRASNATLVVVNHSLLALDRGFSSHMGGAEASLVVDEAQLLPDVLAEANGARVSSGRIGWLVKRARRLRVPVGSVPGLQAAWRKAAQGTESGDYWRHFRLAQDLSAAVGELGERFRRRAHKREAKASLSLARDLALFATESSTHALFVERDVAVAKQLDVAADARMLFAGYGQTVVMSATLRGLPLRRLGLQDVPAVTGPPPFDVASQRLGFVTPKTAEGEAHQWCPLELVDLIRAASGGALVLATSHAQKSWAARLLRLAGFRVAVQDDGSTDGNRDLIEQLRDGRVDVLVGTNGLATGTDIPGPALRLVVLLSWPNPNLHGDPYLRRQEDRIRDEGGDPWPDYFSPLAEITVRQSIGRLLRGPEDYGVVACLEPRRHKRAFADLIAPSSVSSSLGDVRAFFELRR